MIGLHTLLFTLVALFAFAANSVFCRLALNDEQVDPTVFTAIRLLSAALVLWLAVIVKSGNKTKLSSMGSWRGASLLFIYAACFSFAYLTLNTATGALVLFACVQFTMLSAGILAGKTLSGVEKLGIGISIIGFVYFVLPELSTPSVIGLLLMACSGVAWGGYSLLGAGSKSPLADTAGNFIRLAPVSIVGLLFVLTLSFPHLSTAGLLYTLASGVLASGAGYAIWYYVLPKLQPSVAAVSQLSVPIWAALGGVIWVGESVTSHLVISSGLILGGIVLVLVKRAKNS